MNIANILNNYRIKADINMLLDMWSESHRYYHNLDHYIDINRMIKEDYANNKLTMSEYEKLSIANLFHDIIYNPTQKNNEEKSAEFFMSLCLNKKDKDILEIKQIILDTATHKATTPLSEKFNKYDMNIVERDFDSLLVWEKGIHEEHKMYGDLYKTGRLQFLESLLDKYPLNTDNLMKLIEHVSSESNGLIEKKKQLTEQEFVKMNTQVCEHQIIRDPGYIKKITFTSGFDPADIKLLFGNSDFKFNGEYKTDIWCVEYMGQDFMICSANVRGTSVESECKDTNIIKSFYDCLIKMALATGNENIIKNKRFL